MTADPNEADHLLSRLTARQAVELLLSERDRYRDALRQIADAESGHWGQIARAALHPERKAA